MDTRRTALHTDHHTAVSAVSHVRSRFFRTFAAALPLIVSFATGSVGAVTTIVSDNYNVTGSGSGFALNAGINTGINPPTTRLGGTAAANLRYLNTGTKATSAFTISGNKLQVSSAANPGRFVLSADGTTSFDFGPALGIAAASATNRIGPRLKITSSGKSFSSGSRSRLIQSRAS